jgi:hypothetical protein
MRLLRYATLSIAVFGLSLALRADDADAKTARAIVDKAIVAHGGAANLKKFPASVVKFKGTFVGMGAEIPMTGEFSILRDVKIKAEIELDAGGQTISVISVINGDNGWTKIAGADKELDKDQVQEERHKLHLGWVATLAPFVGANEYTLATTGEHKVGEKTTLGVRVTRNGKRDLTLYFDKTSHLLIRYESMVKDDMTGQEVLESTTSSDFKDVKGTKQANKFSTQRDGKPFMNGEVTEIQLLETLDESVFVKP